MCIATTPVVTVINSGIVFCRASPVFSRLSDSQGWQKAGRVGFTTQTYGSAKAGFALA
ncbi:hypothetical protein [Escherichia albertii]|uniref:hypothetical protein n=1 Tax=Escherichia albertii TaxID=208962 RepID=UPI001CF0F954|nr:hypothetical protein [Escherichia albertii]MCB2256869.1 hypothetical protein [Escherichia albertii]MCB2264633.1 hypothetical protein [Escherichia albertii]MCB2270479.1 hypothetical protein [Escherichia albertii]